MSLFERRSLMIFQCATAVLLAGSVYFLGGRDSDRIPAPDSSSEDAFVFIVHDGLELSEVAHIEEALEQNYERVLHAFDLNEMPQITVQIWKDEEAYQAAMEEAFGSRAPGSRGYAYGDRELRLLYHEMPSAQQEAVHEFVHNVSLNVNPSIGNNPRWLWEAVAIYYSGQVVAPTESRAFSAGQCPSPDALNSPFDRGGVIYDSGYTLMEFVAQGWSEAAIIELVHTNADTRLVLGLEPETFVSQWCAYVQGAYFQ